MWDLFRRPRATSNAFVLSLARFFKKQKIRAEFADHPQHKHPAISSRVSVTVQDYRFVKIGAIKI